MIELMIDRKNGSVWDLGQIVTDITWKTSRQAKPASLDINDVNDGLAQSKEFEVENGDIVRFRKDNKDLFYGYYFFQGMGHGRPGQGDGLRSACATRPATIPTGSRMPRWRISSRRLPRTSI